MMISGGDNNLLVTVHEFDPYLWSDNVESMLILNSPNIDMNERWLEVEIGELEATTNLTLSLTSV